MIRNIILIGAGNLASQLGYTLSKKGFNIRQVYSYTLANAELLADKVNAYATDNLNEIQKDADLYIISVKDGALLQVINQLPIVKGIVVHTAGSVNIDALLKFENNGILYPFQTFSKDRDVEFDSIPILIESDKPEIEDKLTKFAKCFSKTVSSCNSNQRKNIHLAAVFACNFSNHMYAIAEELLSKNNISFDVIKPLIIETALKTESLSPAKAQTGPAIRGDKAIMDSHLEMLSDDHELHALYKNLSNRIIKMGNQPNE
ncbi:Rossmann-like and DUF2520 domain-containing protein [Plebeiibacterium marinum]|uniref:DUF2520 domain-containing protein n=1 Tax=Plebeiibacterium marinum TaxID=2992111 RepID=A0AAE3SJN7_9BACT|nr:DUF2520 domain-containing protein [Plebeiobacterium marinum]MCW3805912.1 DUF2520 domain-containing protein [Plebeiobacterium marinum]